jgi:hypothetical protein
VAARTIILQNFINAQTGRLSDGKSGAKQDSQKSGRDSFHYRLGLLVSDVKHL